MTSLTIAPDLTSPRSARLRSTFRPRSARLCSVRHRLTAPASRLVSLLLARTGGRDRGDVPGWVLITLMTAGLVVAVWAMAGPALTNMFDSALTSVKGP